MNCEEAREQLREMGRASVTGASSAHIGECVACSEYAGELAAIFGDLGGPVIERSEIEWKRFHNTVYNEIRSRNAARARRHNERMWRVFPFALAACALLAIMTFLPGQFGHDMYPVNDVDVLKAVYSDYTPFREVSDVRDTARTTRDIEKQKWTAEHILRSGSPIGHEAENELNDLTDEEIDVLNSEMGQSQPGYEAL